MLSKKEVYDLIGNRTWIYQITAKNNPLPTLVILGDSPAYFMAIFHKNRRIEVPTNVGFIPPEFTYWDFDVDAQELLFKDKKIKLRYARSCPRHFLMASLLSK